MTDDKLYTSLSANTIMAKVTNHFQQTKRITSSTDKLYSLDSEDDFRSGCRNVSHQQQFFSELPSRGRSHYTNYITVFSMAWHKIVMQRFLVLYHGISHLSRVFSWCTHSPEGSCVYCENTSDLYGIISHVDQHLDQLHFVMKKLL